MLFFQQTEAEIKINFEVASRCALFRGIDPADLERMLDCLDAREKAFVSAQAIFQAGDPAVRMGVLLSGKAQIVRERLTGKHWRIISVLIAAPLCRLLCQSFSRKV